MEAFSDTSMQIFRIRMNNPLRPDGQTGSPASALATHLTQLTRRSRLRSVSLFRLFLHKSDMLQVNNKTEQYGTFPQTPKGSNDYSIEGCISFNPEGVPEEENLCHLSPRRHATPSGFGDPFAVFRILPSLRDWLYGKNPYLVYC